MLVIKSDVDLDEDNTLGLNQTELTEDLPKDQANLSYSDVNLIVDSPSRLRTKQ